MKKDIISIELLKEGKYFIARFFDHRGDSRYSRCSKKGYEFAMGRLCSDHQSLFGVYLIIIESNKAPISASSRIIIELFKDKPMLEEENSFYARIKNTGVCGSSYTDYLEAVGNLFMKEPLTMNIRISEKGMSHPKIKETIREILKYYDTQRQVGHTTAMIEGVKNSPKAIVLVNNMQHAGHVQAVAGKPLNIITTERMNLMGRNDPLVLDNFTTTEILRKALVCIVDLEVEVRGLKSTHRRE